MQPGFSVGAQVWLSWKAMDAIVLKE